MKLEYVYIMISVGLIVFFLIPYIKNYIKLYDSYDNYRRLCLCVSVDDFHYKLLMKNLRSKFIMTFYVMFNSKLLFVECVKSEPLLDEMILVAKTISMMAEEGENNESCETESDTD